MYEKHAYKCMTKTCIQMYNKNAYKIAYKCMKKHAYKHAYKCMTKHIQLYDKITHTKSHTNV